MPSVSRLKICGNGDFCNSEPESRGFLSELCRQLTVLTKSPRGYSLVTIKIALLLLTEIEKLTE